MNESPACRDTDRDGLTDREEVWTSSSDPDDKDTDGDGRLDGSEVYAGTNPHRRD